MMVVFNEIRFINVAAIFQCGLFLFGIGTSAYIYFFSFNLEL